jgi:hypothetical protein
MSFDEFKLILTGLSNAYGKPGRFGCFYVAIDNNSHFYFFEKLKMSQTMNNDICGLSLTFELQFGLLCKFINTCKRGQHFSFNYDMADIQRILHETFRSIEGRIQAGILDKK